MVIKRVNVFRFQVLIFIWWTVLLQVLTTTQSALYYRLYHLSLYHLYITKISQGERVCVCWPEDVLCVHINVKPIDEEGRVSRLQTQSPFEKLWRHECGHEQISCSLSHTNLQHSLVNTHGVLSRTWWEQMTKKLNIPNRRWQWSLFKVALCGTNQTTQQESNYQRKIVEMRAFVHGSEKRHVCVFVCVCSDKKENLSCCRQISLQKNKHVRLIVLKIQQLNPRHDTTQIFHPHACKRERKKKTSACFWTTSINNPFLAAGSAEWITDSVIRTFCCPLPLLYPPEHLPSKLLSAEQDNASVAVVKEGRSRRRKGEWNNIWQGKKRWVITYSISRAEPNTLLEAKCFSNQALFTIYQLIIKGERNTNKNKKRQFSFWYISLQTEAERRWAVLACSNIVCVCWVLSFFTGACRRTSNLKLCLNRWQHRHQEGR